MDNMNRNIEKKIKCIWSLITDHVGRNIFCGHECREMGMNENEIFDRIQILELIDHGLIVLHIIFAFITQS